MIDNGVRASLIPVLISYCTDRQMTVKWRGEKSCSRNLPGGSAQGSIVGPITYFSQSSDSANCVPQRDRFKFVDDLSVIEIIRIIDRITSYNFRNHVASDIGVHGQYIDGKQLLSQQYSDEINRWTNSRLMKLNEKKTQFMIINYTYDYQFNTRIHINETLLECVNETLLLGVLIQDNMGYDGHVRLVCKKAYSRMSLITKLIKFGASVKDLIKIYIIFMRSVLEYCAVVWHSLTIEQSQEKI